MFDYFKLVHFFDDVALEHLLEFQKETVLRNYRDPIFGEYTKDCVVLIYWHKDLNQEKLKQVSLNGNDTIWLNKPNNSFTTELVIVANAHWFKPLPDDVVVYIGRGRLPEQAHVNGNCGNPFTVKEYGRDIAITKYIESKPDLDYIINLVKPYFGRHRIVLLCWCKPNNCHGDYIKEQIIRSLL